MKRRVLFLCTRIPAGARWLRPCSGTWRQIGIDISRQRPKHISEYFDMRFHRVITLCDRANEECASFPDAQRIYWPFEDPAAVEGSAEERMRAFIRVRQELKARLDLWLIIDRRRADLTGRD